MLTRRQLLKQSAWLAAFAGGFMSMDSLDAGKKRKFKIGACDWSLGKRNDVGAFEIAKNIGLEGIMVDMGSEQNGLPLRKQAMLDLYRETSKSMGVKISSIAIGELNNVPYKSELRTVQWVWDSVDVAKYLGVPVVLLAFFQRMICVMMMLVRRKL